MRKEFISIHISSLSFAENASRSDDAVSSGLTLSAVWDLLGGLCEICVCGVVMRQGRRWESMLGEERSRKMVGVFESPLLKAVDGGWDLRD